MYKSFSRSIAVSLVEEFAFKRPPLVKAHLNCTTALKKQGHVEEPQRLYTKYAESKFLPKYVIFIFYNLHMA